MSTKLQVGFGRIDITPLEPVPLRGYGNTSKRISNNVLSNLYSTCIAFTDSEDNTVLMFHNDLCGSAEELVSPIREAISSTTGIPFSHIMVGATHTHSAPDVSNTEIPTIPRYIAYLKEQMVKCAVEALADRKPAEAYTAKTKTDRLNFVRHYVLADGTFKGDNFGSLNESPYVGHTTEADPEMRLVKFVREGGADVMLVNWQTHPHRTGGSKKYDVSADIIGAMRDEMESALGCKFIYFTGGAGNVNPYSRIVEETRTADYLVQGKYMAEHAFSVMDKFEKAEIGKIQLKELIHNEPINRPDSTLLEHAKEVMDLWTETYDSRASVVLAESYGMNSQYAAGAVIRKHDAPFDSRDVPMYAFSIGDIAFVTAPYEMFDTNAKYIRDFSPFPMTIVSSLSNGAHSYIPSAYGYWHGCYEADQAWFKPGTGEKFARIYVNMLKDLYETR